MNALEQIYLPGMELSDGVSLNNLLRFLILKISRLYSLNIYRK